MSVLLKLEMPEGAFSALRLDPEVLEGNCVLPLPQNGMRWV